MGYFSELDIERQEQEVPQEQGPETVTDVDWKKAFCMLEYLAATMGMSEEVEDIVKDCTYERPVPTNILSKGSK